MAAPLDTSAMTMTMRARGTSLKQLDHIAEAGLFGRPLGDPRQGDRPQARWPNENRCDHRRATARFRRPRRRRRSRCRSCKGSPDRSAHPPRHADQSRKDWANRRYDPRLDRKPAGQGRFGLQEPERHTQARSPCPSPPLLPLSKPWCMHQPLDKSGCSSKPDRRRKRHEL